jgi:hypothetical protein
MTILAVTGTTFTQAQDVPTVENLFELINQSRQWTVSYDIETTINDYETESNRHSLPDYSTTERTQHHEGKMRTETILSRPEMTLNPKKLMVVNAQHRLHRDGMYKFMSMRGDEVDSAAIEDPTSAPLPNPVAGAVDMYTHVHIARDGLYGEEISVSRLEDGTLELRSEGEETSRHIIDPDKGYLVMHGESLDKYNTGHTYDTTEAAEVAPGVWIAAKFEFRTHAHRQTRKRAEGYATVHSIGQPIDDSVFTLEFPEGTHVTDLNDMDAVRRDFFPRDPINSRMVYTWLIAITLAAILIFAVFKKKPANPKDK